MWYCMAQSLHLYHRKAIRNYSHATDDEIRTLIGQTKYAYEITLDRISQEG